MLGIVAHGVYLDLDDWINLLVFFLSLQKTSKGDFGPGKRYSSTLSTTRRRKEDLKI
jgi:hypothetical protein